MKSIPATIARWIIDFSRKRKHERVQLANCIFEWGNNATAGVIQETKIGPWLFPLMINDLILK
jgi:hypothetical protein